jgi:addiction module RelE/StbE family toxin
VIIKYESQFKKQYKKLPKLYQDQFYEKLELFLIDPTAPQLRIHPLKGKFAGYWSMNINGDIRALYTVRGDEIIIFALIGSHSQLYR